ncbi:MAG: hypothetical protein K9L60_10695 [Methylovulum sp.]|nr:hypothetical protein [Methylovulum sp.]MCF7999867.1 hypothetical protein [Methylovulum sp.]
MTKIIQLKLNAYSLREIAEYWNCTERQIIQLALDGKLRLAIKVYNDTLVDIYTNEDGETVEQEISIAERNANSTKLNFQPMGRYIFVGIPDLITIDREGQVDTRIFEEITGEIICLKEPITVKTDYIRLLEDEKNSFDSIKLLDDSQESDMNTMKALAIMAWMLSEKSSAYRVAGRPNAKKINDVIQTLVEMAFPEDPPKLKSFNKKIAEALKLFNPE